MKTNLLPLMVIAVSSTSCNRNSLPDGSRLFIKSSTSDSTSGRGIMIAVEADLTCNVLTELVEYDLFAERLAPYTGVIVDLSYNLDEPSNNEPWLGTYAPRASIIRDNDDDSGLTSDTGEVEASSPGTNGTRTATSSWLEPGGLWIQESAGLRIDIETYSSEELDMKFEHIWAEDSLTVKNCGNVEM